MGQIAVVAIVAMATTAVAVRPVGAVGPETSVRVPFGYIGDMQVDPSTGRIFVSSYNPGAVAAYDRDLNLLGVVQGIGGARDLLLAGPLLYVGSQSTSDITVIDIAALTIVRRHRMPDFAPRSLALADDGRIWIGFGGCLDRAAVGSFHPAIDGSYVSEVYGMGCPTFVRGSGPPGRLVMSGSSGMHAFDTSKPGSGPAVSVSADYASGGRDMEYAPGGGTFYVPGSYELVEERSSVDLLPTGMAYRAPGHVTAVDVSASGVLAFGGHPSWGPDVFTFTTGRSVPDTAVQGRTATNEIAPWGVALSPSADRVYAGHRDSSGEMLTLQWFTVCTLGGTTGPDVLTGTAGDDIICARGGNDTIRGLEGNDTLVGGDGDDLIFGGLGDDDANGGPGRDVASFEGSPAAVSADLAAGSASGEGRDVLRGIEGLVGSTLSDILRGTEFDDVFEGRRGGDVIDGRGGIDTVDYRAAVGGMTIDLSIGRASGDGADRLVSIENAAGSPHRDVLIGTSGDNALIGGAEGDRLVGGGGRDLLDGSTGNDTLAPGVDDVADEVRGGDGTDLVSYSDSIAGLTVDIGAQRATGQGTDAILVEGVIGGAGADQITGSSLRDSLSGGGGADVIEGLDGSDTLRGGDGDDVLGGGGGDDRLYGDAGADAVGGGAGADAMDGGDAMDICVQGSGSGPSTACESASNEIRFGDTQVLETDVTQAVRVPLRLAAPTDLAVSVAWSTANGTAVVPADYRGASGTSSFGPYQRLIFVSVDVHGDDLEEAIETMYVVGRPPTTPGLVLADRTAAVRIDDDDRIPT